MGELRLNCEPSRPTFFCSEQQQEVYKHTSSKLQQSIDIATGKAVQSEEAFKTAHQRCQKAHAYLAATMAVFRDKVKLEESLKEVENETNEEEISLLRQMEALKAKKRKTSTQPLCNFHAMAQQFNPNSLLLHVYSHGNQAQQVLNSEQQDCQGNSTTHTTTTFPHFSPLFPTTPPDELVNEETRDQRLHPQIKGTFCLCSCI